jgi:hypothetical protein
MYLSYAVAIMSNIQCNDTQQSTNALTLRYFWISIIQSQVWLRSKCLLYVIKLQFKKITQRETITYYTISEIF